ncbi:hypothetical protein JXM67_00975 [candidate division WOR-3 bacterium]|nr:hypothetical protein [candidate division WOR-3 bacterium]
MASVQDLKLAEINDWQETISLGSKSAMIQRGDIILDAGPTDGIVRVFTLIIQLVTENPYHHALVYDHNWRIVHATSPHVQSNFLQTLYFDRKEVTLTWARPKHHKRDREKIETWPATMNEASDVIKFAEEQIGKDYDMRGNIGFLFRADGLPSTPPDLQTLFQNRDWLHKKDEWFCSELASGAWW